MLFNKQISYEVLLGQDNRWILDTTHNAKSDAMTRAQALLNTNQHDAIRVTRLENDDNEEVIFHKERTKKAEKPITISAIEEAALCNVADDFSDFEARKTAGRLLRQYLDEWGITALELFHNYTNLRQFVRNDVLYNQALHRIAAIQARATGEDPKVRIDRLYALASKLEKRARKADDPSKYLSLIEHKGLTKALAAIEKAVVAKKRPFVIATVLAAYLAPQRDWEKKLGLVITLLEHETGDQAITLLDQICAEIIDGAAAIKDLLGPQPDLVSTLGIMARLGVGRCKVGKKSTTPLARFNAVMAKKPMPFSQDVLMDKVARAISGTKPLTRESDEADKEAFVVLFKKLIGFGGLIGGVGISEAVTRRARMVIKSGDDDLSPAQGIEWVLSMLPNQAVKTGYLLDLSRSEFGGKYQTDVLTSLMGVVKTISSLNGLLPSGSSNNDVVRAANGLRQRVGESALGNEIGNLLAKKLDSLLKKKGTATKKAPVKAEQKMPAPKKPAKRDLSQRVFQPGDVIFNEGDSGDEAFMIVSGEVEISIISGQRAIVLANLEHGQIIGEMALIDDQPRMAKATAVAETKLSVIPQEAFKKRLDWLAGEDRLISHLLEIFVNRLRDQARNL